MIVDHVWRRHPERGGEDQPCAYMSCGRLRAEHARATGDARSEQARTWQARS